MPGFKHNASRPNKLKAIADAIDAGFDLSALSALYDRGVVYYTLGGESFSDMKMMYNVFGEQMRAAVSYENISSVYSNAMAAAERMRSGRECDNLRIEVLRGDILDSDFNIIPRQTMGIIAFVDLTQFLSFAHQDAIQRWIVGKALAPGDVLYLTTSIPPWELVRKTFVTELTPILFDLGASNEDVTNREYWKANYVKAIVQYFSDDWKYHQLSHTTLRHFFTRVYKDTAFEMVLNGFVVI